MIRFWSIAKNTFVQTIRQPIYGILILVTFAVLLLSLALAGWTLSTDYHTTDQKMLENLGLSTLLVFGLFLAAFSASNVLSREIEDKTALTVISKPVARSTFVLSKFAGVAAAVTVGFYLCSLAFLMTVRHRVMPATADPYDVPVIVLGTTAFVLTVLIALAGNYFFGWPFVSAGVWSGLTLFTIAMAALSFIGKEWKIVPLGHDTPEKLAIHGQLLIAMVLIFMAVLVFVAIAVAASTRLGQVMTLGVCGGVFFLGTVHPWLFGYWQEKVPTARVLGWTIAKLTYFFQIDALSKDTPIPVSYVGATALYCALYIGAVLCVAVALFEKRQLEAQASSSTMPGAVALLAWAGRAAAIAAGIAALVMVSLPRFHSLTGLATVAAIAVTAATTWIIWAGFASGGKWAYWLVWVLAAGSLLGAVALALAGDRFGMALSGPARVIAIATALAAGAVVLILLFPKTRHHFR